MSSLANQSGNAWQYRPGTTGGKMYDTGLHFHFDLPRKT